MKRYFLGMNAAWTTKELWQHFFMVGTKKDSEALKEYLQEEYQGEAILTSSGRAGLYLAIRELLKNGDRVVINGLTCDAVIQAIRKADCVPIFADVSRENLHFGKAEIDKCCKKYGNIRAVIVQNTLGYPAKIKEIEAYCQKNNILIIEDMAHCALRKYEDGRKMGTIGAATVFSFGKGKSIDTVTGGAVIFRAEKKRIVAADLDKPKPSIRVRLYPFFSVVMRHAHALHLQRIVAGGLVHCHLVQRSADAELDLRRLRHYQAKEALLKFHKLEKQKLGVLREFYLVKNREETLKRLRDKGYFFDEVWYDVAVIPKRRYKKLHFPENECPVATELAKKLVNLPTWYKKAELQDAKKIILEGRDE